MILAGTGHRPKYLPCQYDELHPWLSLVLKDLTEYLSTNKRDIEAVISGMAIGWDTWLAETALKLDIPVWAYIPFPNQADKWPAASQLRYDSIVSRAETVLCVTQEYTKDCFFKRDDLMVDHSDTILALWNPEQTYGGTYHTIQYAKKSKKHVLNFWR